MEWPAELCSPYAWTIFIVFSQTDLVGGYQNWITRKVKELMWAHKCWLWRITQWYDIYRNNTGILNYPLQCQEQWRSVLPWLIVSISFVLFFSHEGRSYKLNKNFWHMEKHFCLSDLILVTVCEKETERLHQVFSAPPEEKAYDTFSWHKDWFISNHQEISGFLISHLSL